MSEGGYSSLYLNVSAGLGASKAPVCFTSTWASTRIPGALKVLDQAGQSFGFCT